MFVITGAAGFIGSNLVASLNERGLYPLVISDRLRSEQKWRNLRKHSFFCHVFPEDLPRFLDQHQDEVTTIFHLGASSSTTESDVDRLMRDNLALSIYLWEWCATHRKRFLYASSAATYGDGEQGFDDNESLEYLSSLRPLNAYGWSKYLFDIRIASDLIHKRPTPTQWVGLKFFNVYGPNEYHKQDQQSVLAKLYPYAKENRPLKLFKSYNTDYKDGEQARDFVYVKDCSEIMMWFLDNPKVSGIFNIGSGEARTFNDLARSLFHSSGIRTPRIEYIDMPSTIRDKYQYYTESNMQKLRAAGYTKPMTKLEDGVEDYVQNYLMTDDPYR